ncbi:polysaccharide pyruvyl transferase family protein [Streptomyces nogalater]
MRAVLSDAVEVTVRDEESKLVLEEAGVTRPVSVTADPALLLEPGDRGRALLRAEAVPRRVRLVGMSVREPGHAAEHLDEEGYHQLLAGVGDFLVHRLDAHIVFVSMERGDIRHAHAVASRMAAADHCTVLHQNHGPQEVLDIVAQLDLAVGMRLHFLVFAALAGIPCCRCRTPGRSSTSPSGSARPRCAVSSGRRPGCCWRRWTGCGTSGTPARRTRRCARPRCGCGRPGPASGSSPIWTAPRPASAAPARRCPPPPPADNDGRRSPRE